MNLCGIEVLLEEAIEMTDRRRCREQNNLQHYTIFQVQCLLQCFRHAVVLKDTPATSSAPAGTWSQRSPVTAVASPNWLFIPSVNRGQTTVLLDDNVGDTERIVNQNGLWASWACSSCMNNSHTAEFSSVCGSMQWEFTEDTFLRLWSFLPAIKRGERHELSISFESGIRGCRNKELTNYRVRYAVITKLKAALCFKCHIFPVKSEADELFRISLSVFGADLPRA